MIERGLKKLVLPLAGVLVVALGACAPEPGSEQPQAAATGTTQPATPSANRVNLAQCSTPSNGAVHFTVGEARLALPANVVGDVIPANMKPPFNKEEVQKELQAQAAAGAGCPEKPINASLLLMQADFGNTLLQGTVGLVNTPSPQAVQRFAKLTADLQAKPNRNCKTLTGELLACVGTETRGGKETPVMYVITTDTTKRMNTGGPLAVRCVLGEKKIEGCNLVDQLVGGATFDATLNAGDYSTALLSSARQAVLGKLETWRR